jgi:hypothetical protein
MALTISVAEVEAGLKGWAAFPIADLKRAYDERFGDLADDAKAIEDVAALLAAFGAPYAAEVGPILALAGLLLAVSSPAVPGDPGTYPRAGERTYVGQRDEG